MRNHLANRMLGKSGNSYLVERKMKTLITVVTAVAIGTASLVASSNANAGWRGGGVAAGVIGGVAAGAIIAGANRGYAYGPDYAPAYYGAPAYGYASGCHLERERIWDGYGYRIRRVRVCD